MSWGAFRAHLIDANKRLSARANSREGGSLLRTFEPPPASDVDGLPWVPPDQFPEDWVTE